MQTLREVFDIWSSLLVLRTYTCLCKSESRCCRAEKAQCEAEVRFAHDRCFLSRERTKPRKEVAHVDQTARKRQEYFCSFHAAIPTWCGWWVFFFVQPVHRVNQSCCPHKVVVTFGNCFRFSQGVSQMRRSKGSAEFCGTHFHHSRVSSVCPTDDKYHGCSSRRLYPLFRATSGHDVVRVLKGLIFSKFCTTVHPQSLAAQKQPERSPALPQIPFMADKSSRCTMWPSFVSSVFVVLPRTSILSLLAVCFFDVANGFLHHQGRCLSLIQHVGHR